MSPKSKKPGILAWVAISFGMLLFYLICAGFAGLLVVKGIAPEKIMTPFFPLKCLIEYLAR